MKPGTFTHIIAVLLSSITSFFTHSAPAKVPTAKIKVSKKSNRLQDEAFPMKRIAPGAYAPFAGKKSAPSHRVPGFFQQRSLFGQKIRFRAQFEKLGRTPILPICSQSDAKIGGD